MLQTEGGTRYKGLILTSANTLMSEEVKKHIANLKAQGANIIIGTEASDMSKAAKAEEIKAN